MVARKNYRKRRAPYKTRARKTTSSRKGTKNWALKRIIQRELAKNIENKTVQYLGTSYDILPSNSPGFDGNIIPCYPSAGYLVIPQGVGQGNRCANQIRIKNLRLEGVVFPTPYNGSTNTTPAPTQIKFWFFYDREEPQAVPTPIASGDFFQFGNTSITFQNEFFDHSLPVNRDRYRVLTTRTVKVGYAAYTGTGALPLQGNLANNDFKLNAKIKVNLTKHCVKMCNFRDTASTPTTRGIYMMAQPVYANGSPINASQIPARMEYMMTCDYEDA